MKQITFIPRFDLEPTKVVIVHEMSGKSWEISDFIFAKIKGIANIQFNAEFIKEGNKYRIEVLSDEIKLYIGKL